MPREEQQEEFLADNSGFEVSGCWMVLDSEVRWQDWSKYDMRGDDGHQRSV